MKAALVDKEGNVVNTVVVDSIGTGVTNDGYAIIEIPDNASIDSRWKYVGGQFQSPPYYSTFDPKSGSVGGPYFSDNDQPAPTYADKVAAIEEPAILTSDAAPG